MSNQPDDARLPMPRSDASGVHAVAFDRVPDLASLLDMICACYGLAPADEDPADTPQHYWGCPAGEFLYWATRHPQAVAAWAAPFIEGATPAPTPR